MSAVKGLLKLVDIKDLEDRIEMLIRHLSTINSKKERMEKTLKKPVSAEESRVYKGMQKEFAKIYKKYIKFIHKYAGLNSKIDFMMIYELNHLKSLIKTFGSIKLVRLRKDAIELSKHASEVVDRLNLEEKPEPFLVISEPVLKKLDDGNNVSSLNVAYVNMVFKFLFEEDGNIVGILGSRGIGKTTVLKKLCSRLLEQESLPGDEKGPRLDNVIWIEYPPEPKTEDEIVEMLQNAIMEQLHIDHGATKSIHMNANKISAFLCHKKYIVLMDQVSSYVDLDKLGLRKGHKYKKFVICSRDMKVLHGMTEHVVQIYGLPNGEAWILFQHIYGRNYVMERKRAIAERIIECCAGIPWIIHSVANHLKGKEDDDSWNFVKESLQTTSDSLELFNKIYEMKYEGLAKDVKKCLLYVVLFPLHYKIEMDYLVECWIAEGFFHEKSDQRVRSKRGYGQTILDNLTNEGLLQWHSDKKYVMMPPDFRKVALELEFPGSKKCAIWVPSKDRNPVEETWTLVTRMSLIGCQMELPESPQCPNIYTLLLQSLKHESEFLSDSFFTHMESLQVLNLNHTEIKSLPRSIEKLVNLKSLNLNGCLRLDALPPEAANLRNLEFLDICGTSISTLPQEIRCMVDMRCLRASLSPKGNQVEEVIPPDIISNLTNLEELSIITAFRFGIAEAERLAVELASLEHLSTLCFNFPNLSGLHTFFTRSKPLNIMETTWRIRPFRSFKIFIGCHETKRSYEPDFSGILAERWLRYSTNEEFSASCQKLLNQASAFEIIGHDGLKSFTCSQFDLHSVKVCVVESCKHLENIMNGYVIIQKQAFVKGSLLEDLKKLYLYNLEQLKCIWDGPVPPNSLTNLTSMTIDGCPLLTEILDHELARSLRNLEYLKVENCCKVSKIINRHGELFESSDSELLKSLRKIELSNLPELKSICWNESCSISWNSLKSIIVMTCSKLSNLCLTRKNASKLASIQCEESWWNTLPLPVELRQSLLPVTCFKEESIETGATLAGSELNWAREDINQDYEEDMPYVHRIREEESFDIIGAVNSTEDSSSSYISELRIEQKFSGEVTEEVIHNLLVDSRISASGDGRSKHQGESFTGPICFQENEIYLVAEENNQLQLKLDNQNILIGEYPPLPSPPNDSPVNALLNLVDQDLHELTEKPDYHNSLILLLQRNKRLSVIRPSFFDSMPALCFLDISDTKIRILPTSVFNLPKLKVLLLRNCICLESLAPEIGKLHLEVLDLSGTELYYIPDEIAQLADVTSMRLSFYGPDDESEYEDLPSQLVSPEFLSELKQLQTLSVNVHPQDHRWTEIVARVIEDMRKLEKLSYLEFYFPEVEMFETFIQMSPSWKEQRLSNFNITVGQNVKRIVSYVPEEVESLFNQGERCLRYVNGDKTSPLLNAALIPVTTFYLDHHTEVQSLSEFDVSKVWELRFCVVRECPKMKTILDEKAADDVAIFPHLEYLGIFSLWELTDTWKAPSQAGVMRFFKTSTTRSRSFEALRYLVIKTCPKIQYIIGESMLQVLTNLEELLVEDCERVEKIVDKENEFDVLPGLRKLVLRYLPELVSLGCGDRLSEESISVYYCPKLILNS